MRFELIINLRTDKALGLNAFDPSRADEVIEEERPPGPFGVTSVALCDRWLPIDFRYAPFATEVMRRCKMTRWANPRRVHCKQLVSLFNHREGGLI